MTRQDVLDLYFLDARSRLIDIASFLDRLQRADGDGDFRIESFRSALAELGRDEQDFAKRVLLSFSDPTLEPISMATSKSASGAWSGEKTF